eukprot:3755709-Rhodomonas_salina.1
MSEPSCPAAVRGCSCPERTAGRYLRTRRDWIRAPALRRAGIPAFHSTGRAQRARRQCRPAHPRQCQAPATPPARTAGSRRQSRSSS